jgi:phosphoserine phosphatase RsbU/P
VTAVSGPRLVVHDALPRRVVPIDKLVLTIGRGDGCDLQLAGPEVSREHADITAAAGGYVLHDRRSRHGVFVNGIRVDERVLAHGDRIECGRTGAVLLFLFGEASADEAAPVPRAGDLRQVALLLESLREMGGDRVLDEVLAMVLDGAIEATGAERGVILLPGPTGALEPRLAQAAGRSPLDARHIAISRRIPGEVFESGRTAVVPDLLEGGDSEAHRGTIALGIRHVLAAPLRLVRYVERASDVSARRQIGVLYLDSRSRGRILATSARTAVEALAGEAAAAIENARLYQEALEKSRLDDELRMASRIQQALLPEARRTGPFFDVVGASVPSRMIGGDFFDYQSLPGGRLGVGLGDITGKGPAAALLASLVQGVLAAQAVGADGWPRGTVELLNRILLSRQFESRFVTLFLAALAPDGTLTYCNAAHNPPLLFAGGSVTRLETGGTIIGAFPEAVYEHGVVRLNPGDTLVVFSDGVSEAADASDDEFGEARVRQAVEEVLHEPPERVLRAIIDGAVAFAGDVGPRDDLTAVVLRMTAPERNAGGRPFG